MSDQLRVITTEDGSSSIYHEGFDETYHSTHGAIQESDHVYIKAGLNHWLSQNAGKPIEILEVGMGTGLNVILTLKAQLEIGFPVRYTAIESFPVDQKILVELNYKEKFNHSIVSELFDRLHDLPWEEETTLSLEFKLEKLEQSFQDFIPDETYDLVYYDAFAPEKQAELWDKQWLQKVHYLLKPGGIICSYCAKGDFKRNLKAIGFKVERLPGPPGKAQMIRATKLA
ncbi:MAG: tRNA (5-methylaminomethyl-2-thiouridine)(34)-methyltransferase MnmD [Cyclobacteriaceae bacterium]